MAYQTLAYLKSKLTEQVLIQLTDDENTGAIVESRVDDAGSEAAGIIDGYLRTRYTLPLDSTPDIIREVSVSLTTYALYRRRYGADMPNEISKREAAATKILEHILDGSIRLFEVDKAAVFQTNKVAADKVFGPDTMAKY